MSEFSEILSEKRRRLAAEKAHRAAKEAERQRRLADQGKFGYRFTPHPMWNLEDCERLAIEKAQEALAMLGHEHVARLRSLEVTPYIPEGQNDPNATGYTEGGLVLLQGFLASEGNENKGRLFRCTIPRCIHPDDLGRVLEHFAIALPNAVTLMMKDEAKARACGAVEVGDPSPPANDPPTPSPSILGSDGAPL